MADDKIKKEIQYITILVRSYITSCKKPCFLYNILKDYKECEGGAIPFERLGFNSPIELLESTNQFTFGKYRNEITISAIANPNSLHIAKMVDQQKPPKSKAKRRLHSMRIGNKPAARNSFHQQNNNYKAKSKYEKRVSTSQNTLTRKYADNPLIQPQRQYPHLQLNRAASNSNSSCTGSSAQVFQKDLREKLQQKQQEQQQEQLRQKQVQHLQQQCVKEQQLEQQWRLQQHQQQQEQLRKQREQQRQEQLRQEQEKECRLQQQQEQQRQPKKQEINTGLIVSNCSFAAAAAAAAVDVDYQSKLSKRLITQTINENTFQNQDVKNRVEKFLSNNEASTKDYPRSSLEERLKNIQVSFKNTRMQESSFSRSDQLKTLTISINKDDDPSKVIEEEKQPTESNWHTPVLALRDYCALRLLPKPEYSITIDLRTKEYNCRVNIGDFSYRTYPNALPDPTTAKNICATTALKMLKEQNVRKRLPPTKDTTHSLLTKIYSELLNHPSGMFADNIKEWFETTYKCTLPENWLALIKSSKRFVTDTATPKSNKIIVFAYPLTLDDIVLPWDEEYWQVYITYCVSTTEIWGRLWGKDYSDRFESLIFNIEDYMENNKELAPIIIYNQIYLVCIRDCWHRVRAEVIDKQTVLCFFIDFGDREWCSRQDLYNCPQQFLDLPAQAIRFSMYGLEEFEGNKFSNKCIESFLPYLLVSIKHLTTRQMYEIDEADGTGKISGIFYDTSTTDDTFGSNSAMYESSTADDIILNEVLSLQICNNFSPPELKPVGKNAVIITHISDNGEVSFQVVNNEFNYWQKRMTDVLHSKTADDFAHCRATFDDLKMKKIFLVYLSSDHDEVPLWYRARIVGKDFFQFDKEFNVYFIDRGFRRNIHISNIYCMDAISTVLSIIPGQSMRCCLENIMNPSQKTMQRMRKLLPENLKVSVELVDRVSSKLPMVRVYGCFDGSNIESNINAYLFIKDEIKIDSSSEENIIVDIMKDMSISQQSEKE